MDIPKPYTADLSKTFPGVDIFYNGEIILQIEIKKTSAYRFLHTIIVNALNDAFIKGWLKSHE
jgi:hypothetical protein